MKQNKNIKLLSFFALYLVFISGFLFAKTKVESSTDENLKSLTPKINNLTSFSSPRKVESKEWQKQNSPKFQNHPEYGTIPFNGPSGAWIEQFEKRAENYRYFINSENPSEFSIQKSLGNIHFLKDGFWQTISPKINFSSNGILEAKNQPEPVGFNTELKKSFIKTVGGEIEFNNWKLIGKINNSETEIAEANWLDYTAGDDGIYIKNIFPGIDAEMATKQGAIKTNFIIKKLLFTEFDYLIFKDSFSTNTENCSLVFEDESITGNTSSGNVMVKYGADELLEVSQAIAYPKGSAEENSFFPLYSIHQNLLEINIPVSWIQQHIQHDDIIIDPLVTTTGTLAQNAITGSQYNASCNFINSCNHNLLVTPPASATITNVISNFDYQTSGACVRNGGAITFGLNSCVNPQAGFVWTCNVATPGTCTGTNTTLFPEFAPCMPAPSCNPIPLNFVLRIYRRCVGTAGCNNSCIRAGSPWIITIEGETLEVGSATASGGTSNICLGANANLVSTGLNGTPPYNYIWNPGGLVGQNQTVSPNVSTTYTVTIKDACNTTVTANVTVIVTPNTNLNFTISPNPACVGDAITFTGLGTGNANSYDWLLSSSSSATIANQQIVSGITYPTAGTYNATLNYQQGICVFPIANQIVINDIPSSPLISSNSPICLGQTLNLNGSTIAGATYNWTGSAFSSAIEDPNISNVTNANAGNYQLTVTVNGCTSAASNLNVTINPTPPQPTIAANGPLSFCTGGNVTLTCSVANSYLWSTGATTQSITVSAAGSYTAEITNAQGCTSIVSAATNVSLNSNPPQPTVSANGPLSFCNGNSVTLNSSVESSYLWSNGATTQSINVTTTGNYSVIVSSVLGCSSISSSVTNVVVNSGPGIPTISGGPLTFCQGGNVILSGPAGFTYLWNNGATTQSINLSNSENIILTISDATGCSVSSAQSNVIVNPIPTTPIISANGATTFCQGNNVILSAPSGFNYLWSNGATTQNINVTVSGSFTFVVTDANGCSSLNSNTINVTVFPNPATPIINSASSSICVGNSITLSTNSSASYLWSNGATTQNISTSTPGNYSVSVTDNNGCISPLSAIFNLIENPLPATPLIMASGNLSFCNGGSVTLSAPNGFANYNWNLGVLNTQNISVTESGNYTLQVTDANGCISLPSMQTTVVVFPAPTTPIINSNGPVSFCDGGSVELFVNDINVSYLWSTGATTQNISVDASGNFSVQTTSAQGCISSASANTTTLEFAILPIPVITSLNSTNICDGTTAILLCSAAASYLWQPSGETTQTITVSIEGNYTVSIIDNNGCSSGESSPTNVTVLPLPTTPIILANGLTTFCFGNSVELSSDYASNNLWNSGETTQNITVLISGIFYTTVLGANGCYSLPSNSIEIIVNSPPPAPVITASGSLTFCEGSSVVLSITNSQSYLWSNGATSSTQEFNQSEIITVDVLDICGVPYSLQAQITVLQKPTVLFGAIDTIGCVPLTTSFLNLSNNYNVIYWDFGDGESSSEISPIHTYKKDGKFSVSLTAISLQGCLNIFSRNLLVSVLEKPKADFKTNPSDVVKISKPKVEFVDLSIGSITNWNWTFTANDFSEIQNPIYSFIDTGAYNVKLWIKNTSECTDSIIKKITVSGDLILYVPNAFSPNNDGVNDIFLPQGTYVNPKEYNLKIFSRWGELVFETTNFNQGWDGETGQLNGNKINQIYYWQIHLKDNSGEEHFINGSVNLIF